MSFVPGHRGGGRRGCGVGWGVGGWWGDGIVALRVVVGAGLQAAGAWAVVARAGAAAYDGGVVGVLVGPAVVGGVVGAGLRGPNYGEGRSSVQGFLGGRLIANAAARARGGSSQDWHGAGGWSHARVDWGKRRWHRGSAGFFVVGDASAGFAVAG